MIGYSMPLARESSIGPYEIAAPVRAGGMGEVHWPNPESKTKVHRRMRLGSGATRSLVKCLAESLPSQILHGHGTSRDFWPAKNRARPGNLWVGGRSQRWA